MRNEMRKVAIKFQLIKKVSFFLLLSVNSTKKEIEEFNKTELNVEAKGILSKLRVSRIIQILMFYIVIFKYITVMVKNIFHCRVFFIYKAKFEQHIEAKYYYHLRYLSWVQYVHWPLC